MEKRNDRELKILSPVFNQTEDTPLENIVQEIKNHARILYESKQYLCAEAVLISMNSALGGGLTEKQAISMAAPFCIGMGDSGCLCGALSGAVLSSGLFTGSENAYACRKKMRKQSRMLHDNFKRVNGATCCRSLSKNIVHDKKARFRHCAELTANSAEMAARLVLAEKPELRSSKHRKTSRKYNLITGLPLRIFRWLFH